MFDERVLFRNLGSSRRWTPPPRLQYRYPGKRDIRDVNIFDFDGTLVGEIEHRSHC